MLLLVQDLLAAWAEAVASEMSDQRISMAELARRCDVNVSTISRFLSGKLNPNDELKWKIAGALHQRMDLLFAWPRIVPPAPQKVPA
jgi:transcriptional regulator with XRE-family HTH domain